MDVSKDREGYIFSFFLQVRPFFVQLPQFIRWPSCVSGQPENLTQNWLKLGNTFASKLAPGITAQATNLLSEPKFSTVSVLTKQFTFGMVRPE